MRRHQPASAIGASMLGVAVTWEAAMRTQSRVMLFLFVVLALNMSDQPALSDPPKKRYVFVENTDRWVAIFRGELELLGKLDKDGDFVHEHQFNKGDPRNLPFPPPRVINFPGLKPKKVYEFRSKILVPGELQPDGRFLPEVGGKVIPFKDYEYTPTAPRIWNLPGCFVTEEEAAKLKQPKPTDKK
jgi:hypothetical protein